MRLAPVSLCLLGLAAACRGPTGDAPGISASAPAPRPEEGRAAHGLFELAHARDYRMSVDAVRDCHAPPLNAPRRGYVRIGVEVTIEGTSDREVPANPFYATLRDASGEAYVRSLSGCEPELRAVRVTRGLKARGHLSFDVQRTATTLELLYAPPVIGEGVEELRFELKR